MLPRKWLGGCFRIKFSICKLKKNVCCKKEWDGVFFRPGANLISISTWIRNLGMGIVFFLDKSGMILWHVRVGLSRVLAKKSTMFNYTKIFSHCSLDQDIHEVVSIFFQGNAREQFSVIHYKTHTITCHLFSILLEDLTVCRHKW